MRIYHKPAKKKNTTNNKIAKEEPIILLPEYEEDEVADLSWMIRDKRVMKQQSVKNNKRKNKKS